MRSFITREGECRRERKSKGGRRVETHSYFRSSQYSACESRNPLIYVMSNVQEFVELVP